MANREKYRCSCCDEMKPLQNSAEFNWAKQNGVTVLICRRCENNIRFSNLKSVKGYLNKFGWPLGVDND